MKPGVAVNPHTSVKVLEGIISEVDLVILMSVNPGFGGQKFIEGTYDKVHQLRELISVNKLKTLIEVDGGVDLKNAGRLIKEGADSLVAGTTVFASSDPTKTIADLKAC